MTAEMIKKINEKYPVFMVDMIEDSQEYKELILEMLHQNGLHNVRHFDNPDAYEKALEENPDLTPHIALVDYRFPGSLLNGIDIAMMLVKRSKHKSLRTKVIMITAYDNPKDIRRFFHKGGFAWLEKHESDFKEQLIEKVMEAIVDIHEALEERAWIDGLEEDVLK